MLSRASLRLRSNFDSVELHADHTPRRASLPVPAPMPQEPPRTGSNLLHRLPPRFSSLYLDLGNNDSKSQSSPMGNRQFSTPRSNVSTPQSCRLDSARLSGTPSMKMVQQVKHALAKSQRGLHRMEVQSTGAVYKMPHDLAVFKPEDEEVLCRDTGINCEKVENPVRTGLLLGGGARRERAAYVLDRLYDGFSGVPPTQLACIDTFPSPFLNDSLTPTTGKGAVYQTTGKARAIAQESTSSNHGVLVKTKSDPNVQQLTGKTKLTKRGCSRRKRGSLQKFCVNEGSAEDRYDLLQRASAFEVQRIAILDVRLFNTDRHGGNILVHEELDGSVRLIPIDHGLTLPHWRYLAEAYFDWTYWPQANIKFTPDVVKHIKSLDVEQDATHLMSLGIRGECVLTNRLCTCALKTGVEESVFHNARDLANYFQRPYPKGHREHANHPSQFEVHIDLALKEVGEGGVITELFITALQDAFKLVFLQQAKSTTLSQRSS